ncbi:Cytochrome c7 [Candidatus Electrothrix aarhusensis]
MILGRKYVRAAVFYGLFAVVTGGLVLQNMPSKAVAQEKSDAASGKSSVAPDECYESIKGATELSKVDNVVPKYGYPNVKCSPTTGAVLWYGDPYGGTEPMGEMPSFGDHTDGDFAQAVIRPRAKSLKTLVQTSMQCSGCHPGVDQATQENDPRQLMMHQDIVADGTALQHGRGAIWCFDCHNAANRDTLVDQRGQEVSFNESYKVCGSCHGDTYGEWRMGLHGKRTGEWKVGGKKRWWACTECHNPHTVQEHRFNPIKPEPPPALPRGMSKEDYKAADEHGDH